MPTLPSFSPSRRRVLCFALVASCTVFSFKGPARADAMPPRVAGRDAGAGAEHGTRFTSLPLRFEPNEGQADARARFVARSRNGVALVTPTEAVLRVSRRASAPEIETAVVRLATVGSNPNALVTGLDRLPGVTNYFIGNDPSTWRTRVPGYARVKVEGVYPGIDMVYYGTGRDDRLEYDFDVAPGADPGEIALAVEGADSIAVDAAGDLVLRTAVGEVRQRAPKIYQDVDGARREVAGGYVLRGEREVGFELAPYDASREVVIDPELVYATYLGGGFIDGDIASLAVDASGAAYVCGSTQSTDFPTEHAFQGVKHANETAFVTKLSPDGSSLVYSTYLGGSLFDLGWGIAVNAAGEAYVTGTTSSDDFPVKNAIQPRRADHSMDAFVTKLSADGSSLVFSTFLGGSGNEQPAGIRLDPDSNAYVFGTTTSTDFPLKLAAQTTYGGGIDDGFAAVVDANGSALLGATYFGGNGEDKVQSLALDPQNHFLYLSGYTSSTDLSPTGASVPSTLRGNDGALQYFVVQFGFDNVLGPVTAFLVVSRVDTPDVSPAAAQFVHDVLAGLLVGLSDQGRPLRKGAAPENGAFVATLDQDLHQVAASGISIPSGQNFLGGLAVGPNGAIYAAGATNSDLLPLHDPLQSRRGGFFDTYVVAFAPGSLEPVFSTYLGGGDDDFNWGIALDPQGNIYVVGSTSSTDFPTAGDPFQSTAPPSENAFVAKISPVTFPPDFAIAADPASLTAVRGAQGDLAIDVTRTGGFAGQVTVTAPATKAIKVKLTPASSSTSGDSVTFHYKIKKKAHVGTYDLTFAGKDAQGRERDATLSLTIQ